jgi:predicted nucleotidyltransferase component of viral defense system
MNTGWLKLSKQRKIDILNQASNKTGLPAIAIEKDWWVTLTLNASFDLDCSPHIVFKGGTSLSKCWNLIERFSEDIDLAIDRNFFGFIGDISKNQIKQLRKKSCEFISTTFVSDLTNKLSDWKIGDECSLNAQEVEVSDKDPQIIEINYNSVLEKSDYLPQRVLIEISSRSLMEPSEEREINSLIGEVFNNQPFATKSFYIPTVLPQRTFLEKMFLLYEEFSQDVSRIQIERLSRHLYDLEKLMDTEYGTEALNDKDLFENIVNHRKKFNAIRGLDYSNHIPGKIKIIPPAEIIKEWEKDYNTMKQNMIYGESLNFDSLIKRIEELQKRVNQIN